MTGHSSLYRRATTILVLMVSAAAAVLVTSAWHYAQRAADDAYDRILVGAALQIAESIFVQEGVVGVDPPASAFETLAFAPDDRIFYKVVDPRGNVLTGYDDLPSASAGAKPARAAPSVEDATYRGTPIRLASVSRFLTDAALPGSATVLVAQTRRARAALAGDLASKAFWLLAAMFVLALLGVLLAVRLALAPLRAIERTLQARDPKDLAPLGVETPREIATLVGAINFFMGRLSNRIRQMERFIADAAHQIRTPLTALAAQVDMLARADEPQREQHQRRVEERTAELGRLTNQLLNHAMVIHRAEVVPFKPVELRGLARRALVDAVPLSLDRDIAIGLEAPPDPVEVPGDEVGLREALANLLHNAVKYGARSKLDIELSADENWAVLTVIDDGPGIPEGDWEQAKRPFSGSGTGSGLGLAIVNDVVHAHSGQLDFARRQDGFAASLRLPRGEAAPQAKDRPS